MKWKLFQAGLIVGLRQLLAVLVLGSIALLVVPLQTKSIDSLTVTSDDSALLERNTDTSLGTVLAVADLLVALGLVVTSTRPIVSTAYEIKHAARRRNPANPFGVVERLIGLAGIAALGCAFLALTGRHSAVASLEGSSFVTIIALLMRPGLASVGVAFFGAFIRAALLSKKLDYR